MGQLDNDRAQTILEKSLVLWPFFINIAKEFVRYFVSKNIVEE